MTTIQLPPHPAEVAAPSAEPSPPRSMVDASLPAYESHSSISVYRGCPLRYGYRYVERRPGHVSPGQYAFGNAIHKAFEAFGRARIAARAEGGGEPGLDVLHEAFDRKICACGLTPDELEDARRRAIPVLDRFLEAESATTTEPVGVELGFGVDVALPAKAADGAGSMRFVGYVDRVDRAPDGSTVIVDYKTGRPRSQADVDADPQLTAYAFGCARGGLRDPATGDALPPARGSASTSPSPARSPGRRAPPSSSPRSRRASSRPSIASTLGRSRPGRAGGAATGASTAGRARR